MNTYLKTLVRIFKKQFTRLLSIIFMVVISVGFIAGIGSAVDKINYSLSDYYLSQNVSDFILKSKYENGFSSNEIQEMKDRYGENNVSVGMSIDAEIDVSGERQLVRLYIYDGEQNVNIKTDIESQSIDNQEGTFISAEEKDNNLKGISLGTQITLNFKDILKQQLSGEGNPSLDSIPDSMLTKTLTVTKTVLSPLTFALDGEPSHKNGEDIEIPDNINDVNNLITIENVLYLTYSDIPRLLITVLPKGDMYIAIGDRNLFKTFSDKYKNYVMQEKNDLTTILGGKDKVRVLTLYDNYSFNSLASYASKVRGICLVLMIAFLLVTALVVMSTMTRLIEEERAQVACLSTLGYPSWRIIFKYVLFAMIGCGIGGVGAYFVEIGVAILIYTVFNYSFVMPPMTSKITLWFYLAVYFSIVIVTLISTTLAGRKLTREKPANLLRPKAPRAGKKVILERLPYIWNLLSFKYKSTMRNVLRYKSRFFMTVVAVAFSTALVFAGLSLLDLCLFHGVNSPSVMAVAIVVVFFAGLLTAVVIYTLTNINISERNKEIATLMVLGYRDGEVAGYIYREVYIDTIIGIILGYPFSALLTWGVFTLLGMGTLGGVSWFVWLIVPFIILFFTALVTLILRFKIVKINMNESLKATE